MAVLSRTFRLLAFFDPVRDHAVCAPRRVGRAAPTLAQCIPNGGHLGQVRHKQSPPCHPDNVVIGSLHHARQKMEYCFLGRVQLDLQFLGD